MKTKNFTALAAAIAFASASSAYAQVDLLKTEEGSLTPGAQEAVPPESPVDPASVEVTRDLRVYLHTAIEIEKEYGREDPASDGRSYDEFDNEIEFGVGAEFDQNWEAYFEMEIDNLQDDSESKIGNAKKGGDIEIRSAWVNWSDDNLAARVGRFRPDLYGKTRLWYREELVGARLNYDFGGGLIAEAGTGVLAEEGDYYGDDRTITWLTARVGGLYATQGLFQHGGTTGDETFVDPADGPFGDLYNLAVGWKGKFGGVGAHLEFNQQFGEAKTGEEYKGQAAYAEFSSKVGAHKPHLLLAWGSGDDSPEDDDVDEFQEARADTKFTKLMIDENYVENITTDGVGGIEENGSGIGNITLAQIGSTFKVNPIWRSQVTATYLTLSEDNADGDNYLGTEINFLNRWDLPTTSNVRLYLDMAYVFAGDAFGPDDVWLIEPGVRVTF